MENEKLKEEIERILGCVQNDFVSVNYAKNELIKLFKEWHNSEVISKLDEIISKLK